MQKTDSVSDLNGRSLFRGDTVTTISGDMTGKIYDIAADSDTGFVRLRPVHQPYQPGIWHAADQVVHLRSAKTKSKS
jgi:hypothetical protein